MKKNLILVSCVTALLALTGCGTGLGTIGASRAQIDNAIHGVGPAVVRIHVVMTAPSGGRLQKLQGSGSGAIISPDGYVITNHHVAGRAEKLVCRLADHQEIDATLVASDPMCDIAVLKLKLEQLKDPKAPLPVAQFGDSDALRVGDTVLAMGCPSGLGQSVTLGIVSNTEMILPYGNFEQEGEPVGMLVRWIGHDATIFHGNSGGPLVNLKGQIVGINEIGIANIGGAIPGNIARSVAWQLIRNKRVERSWTGMECQPLLKGSGLEHGVLIGGVSPKSPAAAAGLKPGDIVLSYEGHPVTAKVGEELPLYNQLVLSTPVGKKVQIVALRDGKEKTFDLTTALRDAAMGKSIELKGWGMTAEDFTTLSAIEVQHAKEGVLVETIHVGGPCSEAKPSLASEDVIVELNGKKVKDMADLIAQTKSLTADNTMRKEVLVGFERGAKKYLTVVKVGKEPEPDVPSQSRKAWLGVDTQVLTTELAKALDLAGKSGVRVIQVLPGTTAQDAGLKVGDVILKFDGDTIDARHVEDVDVLKNMIRQRSIGAEVALDIVRDGKPTQVTVKLQRTPTPEAELKEYRDDDFEFVVREMSDEDRADRNLGQEARGLLIKSVTDAGWASVGGMRASQLLLSIDGKPVNDVATLQQILTQAKKNKAKRMVFQVKQGVHTQFLELEPNWEK